jgi:hypothetical protein
MAMSVSLHAMQIRFFTGLIACLLLSILQSCTTSVVVKGSIPTPLVDKIPARVGIYFPDEFKNYLYQESLAESGSWKIDLGEQNLKFFRNLSKAMFESVVEVHEPPLTLEEMADLDAVLVPNIAKYGFLTPSISGLKFYSASIEYHISMFDKQGEKIGDWNIIGYGKSEGGMFTADDALNESTVLAIRDGGARIAIELIQQSAVQNWIKSLNNAEPSGSASLETGEKQ